MSEPEKVTGEQGNKVEDKPKVEGLISKEETMFKIGPDGKAIPEKFPIYIYDHNLDRELIEESMLLLESIKKQESISKVLEGYKVKQDEDIAALKKKIDVEKDEKLKAGLTSQLNQLDKIKGMEEVREKVNEGVILSNIEDSRKIIRDLNALKEKQKQDRFVELMPCTSSEAYLAFEKGKTIDNKESPDWVADLISKRCFNPNYTFDEAKKLRPDFKIAIKHALMEASDYKVESYRDVMLRKNLEDKKPLIVKKG